MPCFKKPNQLRKYAIFFLFVVLAHSACSKSDDGNPEIPSNGKLEGMYFVTRYGYNTGGTYAYFEPFLLLKDGSIRKNLEAPYETLDLEQDKASSPGDWGTWEKNGGKITVQWQDDTETWENWYSGFPAEDGEKIEGTYKSLFALAHSRRGERYTFRKDGSFTMVRQVAGGNNQELSGTYRLKSYGIFLNFSDGTKESWSFIFYPKEGKKTTGAFLMAGDNFSKEG